MIVKVCGMRDSENIRAIEQTKADLMGFIFHPKSPRFVASLPEYMPKKQKRVGVFVNASLEQILAKAQKFSLEYIQLHGDEPPAFCSELKNRGLKVIRALRIANADDIIRAESYNMSDLMIFDTKTELYGGSGKKFNWQLLENYKGCVPFLLSGGIRSDTFEEIKAFFHPQFAGIDLNSGFEISPALKDVGKLNNFIEKIKGMRP
ncbi:MAG: phosphoribosylanthranilate isomerase [Prevotellaceae bacterium]|nr:phosphoribosylanthranilate isomerase [Prevotellaceae bacterium]MDY4760410.1 phosphoribosylanthranilate isomerase [Bacteroidaceae bacterium]